MKHEFARRNCRKKGPQRLNTRVSGGNWQGKQYLSYQEHDRCTRFAVYDATDNYVPRTKQETRKNYDENVAVLLKSRA